MSLWTFSSILMESNRRYRLKKGAAYLGLLLTTMCIGAGGVLQGLAWKSIHDQRQVESSTAPLPFKRTELDQLLLAESFEKKPIHPLDHFAHLARALSGDTIFTQIDWENSGNHINLTLKLGEGKTCEDILAKLKKDFTAYKAKTYFKQDDPRYATVNLFKT
jgi:hypothetical protein